MALTMMREGTNLESQIDRMLHIAAVEWFNLPETLADFDHMDPFDQMEFLLDWPLVEDRARRLAAFARGGEMNSDQFSLFIVIVKSIARFMPYVEKVFQNQDMVGDFLTVEELGIYE